MQRKTNNNPDLKGQIGYIKEELEKNKLAHKGIEREFNKGNYLTIKVLQHINATIKVIGAVHDSLIELQSLKSKK